MTYPPGPDHVHAVHPGGRPDLPDDIDPTGVPCDGGGQEVFVMLVGILVGLLALIVTLGWVVLHHLQAG